jgi:NAD(P)H-hydrate repair Nnr-like enzyme with NAD(P)H-hydrate dehydratase domain
MREQVQKARKMQSVKGTCYVASAGCGQRLTGTMAGVLGRRRSPHWLGKVW